MKNNTHTNLLQDEEVCLCDIVKVNFNKNNTYNDNESSATSDDEDEEEFFDFLKVDLTEEIFTNLTSTVSHPLVTVKPIIKIYDDRMGKELIDLIKAKIFFAAEDYSDPLDFNKKADYLLTLPNSYISLMKKPIDSKDVICAPLYMNETEIKKFCKPLLISKKYFGQSRFGMSFKYDMETKGDMQSNYVYHQRLFFDKILKERLTNKAAYGKDAEYELPLTVFEPVSLIRRFCDLFCYIGFGFEEIYSKSDYDEEVIIRKIFSSLIAGFHKALASQGVPLKPLIGETYEVLSEDGDMQLFCEVKNDDPIHLVYNIRWKKRKACLDGSCLIKSEFREPKDEVKVKIGGTNTVRLWFDNIKAYKIFTFNLPLRVGFKGIVDPINDQPERNMSVDSFIYVKGETKSAIIGLNHMTHGNIFLAFYGMITKAIINYEILRNGHSFFGVIFHNSGFSLENVKEGFLLQAFAVNTSRRIESIQKLIDEKLKNDKNLKNEKKIENKINDNKPGNKDGRIVAVSWEDFFQDKEQVDVLKEPIDIQNIESEINKKENNENLEFYDEEQINVKKTKRINVYPFKIYYDLFKKTVVNIYKLSSSNGFISSFNMHFIYKLYVGSWAYLNFFEIAYQGNEMNEFYIKYKMGQVNARPISEFNQKKGLKVSIDDNNFFGKYKTLYGKLWKPVMKPLITDTRYREDLLWLIRFYELAENYPVKERDPDKLDLFDKIRMETFLNAGKWKEILEAYTYLNISKKINEGKKDKKK